MPRALNAFNRKTKAKTLQSYTYKTRPVFNSEHQNTVRESKLHFQRNISVANVSAKHNMHIKDQPFASLHRRESADRAIFAVKFILNKYSLLIRNI